jgi:hypothetical protein
MKTIINLKKLTKIEFQTDENNVLITCYINENKTDKKISYFISHTELNVIIGNLQQCNADENIYDYIEMLQLNESILYCILDFEKFELKNNYFPQELSIDFNENRKQIRA